MTPRRATLRTMEDAIRSALAAERTIDITTTGRRTGRPRRIEIWFHNVDGRIYITGMPGRRSWYANLLADPALTFHLKESIAADLAGTARPITDEAERREILEVIVGRVSDLSRLDHWVARSPLVEVSLDGV